MGYYVALGLMLIGLQFLFARWIPVLSGLCAILGISLILAVIGNTIFNKVVGQRKPSPPNPKSQSAPAPPRAGPRTGRQSTQTSPSASAHPPSPSHASLPSPNGSWKSIDLNALAPEDRKAIVRIIAYVRATKKK